jgi:hypothetical protein
MVDRDNNINNSYEHLTFTQTSFDFWFILIFFCGLVLVLFWKELHGFTGFAIFVYSMIQIFVPVYIIFRIVGIRYFEITAEYIMINIGKAQRAIVLTKDNIEIITITYIQAMKFFNRNKPAKIVFNFIYKKDFDPHLTGLKKFFYGKKISVNHNLFLEETSRVVAFLEKYYSDKLLIDNQVKAFLKSKYGDADLIN